MQVDIHNCNNLNSILGDFCVAFGQSINKEKSAIFFSLNTLDDLKDSVENTFNIFSSNESGKYLGLPTHWEKSKSQALAYVKDRIQSKINGWKTSSLSQAGRETLIKSVVTAVPTFPMSLFLLPVNLCDAINSEIANFWWGTNDENKKKIHWKAWSSLCKSKKSGGMGFRDLQSFNISLLAKQRLRFIKNPGALWARVIKVMYFPSNSFLEVEIGSMSSWAWSCLLAGRKTIERNMRWQINSGKNVDV